MLKTKLLDRGYKSKVIDILENDVRVDKRKDRVRAVFRFDMRLPNLSAIFRKNWQAMVSDDLRLHPVYPKPPRICYTRGKNYVGLKYPQLEQELLQEERKMGSGSVAGHRLCPYTGQRNYLEVSQAQP